MVLQSCLANRNLKAGNQLRRHSCKSLRRAKENININSAYQFKNSDWTSISNSSNLCNLPSTFFYIFSFGFSSNKKRFFNRTQLFAPKKKKNSSDLSGRLYELHWFTAVWTAVWTCLKFWFRNQKRDKNRFLRQAPSICWSPWTYSS